jgi:hypothetical protein
MATLLARWLFDIVGATTPDGSGNANTATLVSSGGYPQKSTGPGRMIPSSMLFNGSGGYLDVGAAINALGNEFSIAAWIKTSTPTTRLTIFSCNNVANTPVFSLSSSYSTAGLELTMPGVYLACSVGSLVSADTWTHVAVTRVKAAAVGGTDGVFFYVNGVAAGIAGGNSNYYDLVTGSPTPALIGARSSAAQFWNGNLGDVRAYSGVLTAAEVQQLHSGVKFEPTLIGME